MITFDPIDFRNDPRILHPRVQRPRSVSGCQAEVVADLLQWEHPFEGGHSCAFLHRLSQEFRLHPGDTFLDILAGVQEVGTTPEWKYPTKAPNTYDRPLPDSVRQGAIKGVVRGVTNWSGDASSLPTYLGQYLGLTGKLGRPVGVSMPWDNSLRYPFPDGIIHPDKSMTPPGHENDQDSVHYVTILGLIPLGRRNELHYIYDPHRGKDYGDHGYGYLRKSLYEKRDREWKFYVLN